MMFQFLCFFLLDSLRLCLGFSFATNGFLNLSKFKLYCVKNLIKFK